MHNHLGTPQYTFENLAGTTNENGITITHLVSRSPVAWAASCGQCSTQFTVSHTRARTASCPNNACGRESVRRSTIAQTKSPDYAVRSRDAQSARDYQHEQEQRKVTYSFTGEPSFAGADPSSIAAYLEYQQGKNS